MNAKMVGALSAGVVLAATTLAVPAVSASGGERVVQARYDNCTQLNRDFSHGISNRHLTRRQWIRKGASGKGAYKPKLYRAVHSTMDADDDHIACEK